jgi:uncharacterized protein (TIGR02271 family)
MTGDELLRHEETLQTETESVERGRVRLRKQVEEEPVAESVDVGHEDADIERVRVEGEDSGEVEMLADGSISVPLFGEELVITKRLVVRERVIVRKRTELDHQVVESELRRERIEIDADDGIEVRGDVDGDR